MQDDGRPLDLDGDDEEPIDLDDDDELPVDLAAVTLPPDPDDDEPPIDLDDGGPPLHRHEGGDLPLDRKADIRSLSDEKERQRVLADVLRDQARREVLRDVAYRSYLPSVRLRVVAGVLVAAALLVWFIPVPGFRAEIPFPLPPEEEEAGLKLATWVQAQQVEIFRQRSGRLPDVLREAGEALPGMRYERIDAQTYRLSGTTERVEVNWTSTDTMDTQLREAVARLRGIRP